MAGYKPGQVSATLFSATKKVVPLNDLFPATKKVVPQNDGLAKLFSSKSPARVKTKSPVAPERQINHEQDETVSKSAAGRKKLKVKEANGGTVTQGPAVSNKTVKKQAEPFPYVHEALAGKKSKASPQNQPNADVPPRKKPKLDVAQQNQQKSDVPSPIPWKVENGKHDDDDLPEIRHRRDRKRDKLADKRTLFIGNCPLSADKKEIKKLFKEFGEIETVRFRCAPSADPLLPRRATVITKNFHDKCNNLVAYIVFREEEAAQAALARNGYLLDGLHLRIDIAALAKKHDKKRSVFVGNLPFTISEETLREHFSDCGQITNVRIIRDRITHLGKGICYVQFESKDSVGLALKLNQSLLQGRQVRVMVCTSKQKTRDAQLKTAKKPTQQAKTRKLTFAPSNLPQSKFQTMLKAKKEKRFRKMNKKKEKSKKQDGLSAIFGDLPATKQNSKVKTTKKFESGKFSQRPAVSRKKTFHKGSSFKGGQKKTKKHSNK